MPTIGPKGEPFEPPTIEQLPKEGGKPIPKDLFTRNVREIEDSKAPKELKGRISELRENPHAFLFKGRFS